MNAPRDVDWRQEALAFRWLATALMEQIFKAAPNPAGVREMVGQLRRLEALADAGAQGVITSGELKIIGDFVEQFARSHASPQAGETDRGIYSGLVRN